MKKIFYYLTALCLTIAVCSADKTVFAVHNAVNSDGVAAAAAKNAYTLTIEPVNGNLGTIILDDEDKTIEFGVYIINHDDVPVTGIEFAVYSESEYLPISVIEPISPVDVDPLYGFAFNLQPDYSYGFIEPQIKKSTNISGELLYQSEYPVIFGQVLFPSFLFPNGQLPVPYSKDKFLAHFNVTIDKDTPTGAYVLDFDDYFTQINYNQTTLTTQPFTVNVRQQIKISDIIAVIKATKPQTPYNAKYDINKDGSVNVFDVALIKREYLSMNS
ncbi:MAG: hypothetical protein LBM93_13255 [Oscillospiraceae bacterium]|jgi:hypothetical protein|nr:hypothetical protein [Oscillospiraceae bacterium]